MARELIVRTLRVQENKSNSNDAIRWCNVKIFNEITTLLTTHGFKRVDSNGDHGYQSQIAPPNYIYASFVPNAIDYPTESCSYFLTIRNNNHLTASAQAIYWGFSTTIPADSSSAETFSPNATAGMVVSSGQVGSEYYRINAIDYCVLTNNDISLFGFGTSITRLTAFRYGCTKNVVDGFIDVNNNAIYTAEGSIVYLSNVYTSAYITSLMDEYSEVSESNERSKIMVYPVGLAPTSTVSQNIDFSSVFTDIYQIAGGVQRENGDVLRLYQNNNYRRYAIIGGKAYCFYQG